MSHDSSDTLEQTLCKRLELARLNQNVSQSTLADESGVSRRTISRMENGDSVSLNTFVRIARALGLADELDALFRIPDIRPIDRVRKQPARKNASSPRKTPSEDSSTWTWAD